MVMARCPPASVWDDHAARRCDLSGTQARLQRIAPPKRLHIMASNVTEVKIEIQWIYTPVSFFEEKIVWERANYIIEMTEGLIIAQMDAAFFDAKPEITELLRQELNFYFLGAQVFQRQPFQVSGGSFDRVWPDGRRESTLAVQSAEMIMTADSPDLSTTDEQGVIHDTRRDRIEAKKELGELSARHCVTDPTARRILDSFDASIRYPGNELIYLYEVWEAVQTKFRGERKARRALGLSRIDRSMLTNLADREPINQGRHRGKFAGRLRNATSAELDEARRIARDIIKLYLAYLDKQQGDIAGR